MNVHFQHQLQQQLAAAAQAEFARRVNVSDAKSIQNLCAVNTQTLRFDPATQILSFETTTLVPCKLEIHVGVRVDIYHGSVIITPNKPKTPPPSVDVPACPEGRRHDARVPVAELMEIERRYEPRYPKQFTIVITLRYLNEQGAEGGAAAAASSSGEARKRPLMEELRLRQAEHTCIVVEPALKVVRQIVEADGSSYRMESLFGGEHEARVVAEGELTPGAGNGNEVHAATGGVVTGTGEDADNDDDTTCVICLSEERETAVLPCRHLCLCKGCAEELRKHTPKCPVCRGQIEQLLTMPKKQLPAAYPGAATVSPTTTGRP
jgi:hypothetical protein